MNTSSYDRTWAEVDKILAPGDLILGSRSRWEIISKLANWINKDSQAIANVFAIHQGAGTDLSDEGLNDGPDICTYCTDLSGGDYDQEPVIYPCETVKSMARVMNYSALLDERALDSIGDRNG